jgi:hypothetical protein
MPISRKPRPVARREAMMESPYAKMPFARLLLLWAAFHVSRIIASMKPGHPAGQISADVAATNNPTGA